MESSIQRLIKTPPQELLKELDEVREREQVVAHERELLERVLEILVESGGESADWLNNATRGVITIGPLRSQIVRALENEPASGPWLPREVHQILAAHGNKKVTLDNVRTTMVRMVASGELVKPDPKKRLMFALPPGD